jgi:hypothetical protein
MGLTSLGVLQATAGPASAPRFLPPSSRTAPRLSYCSTARTCWGPSASSTGIHRYAWALAGAGPEGSARRGTVATTWRPPSAAVSMAAWAACTSSLPMARVCVRRVGGMRLEQWHSHAGPQPWLAGRGRCRCVVLQAHARGAGLSCTHSTTHVNIGLLAALACWSSLV